MQVTHERRVAPRKKTNLAVLCKSEAERGVARIVNISLSGALLEHASIQPEQDATVTILFAPPRAKSSTKLSGTVVRHTEIGFAIQFLAINDGLRDFMAEAA
jgi:hypothetical protein